MLSTKALKIYKLFKAIVIIFLRTASFSYSEVGRQSDFSSLNFFQIILETFLVILSANWPSFLYWLYLILEIIFIQHCNNWKRSMHVNIHDYYQTVILQFSLSLRKICHNTGYLWLIFSYIGTESSTLSSNRKI